MTEKKISRRKLLFAAAGLGIAALGISCYPRQSTFYLFGEDHGEDNLDQVVHAAKQKGVSTIGLEGVPKGMLTTHQLNDLQKESQIALTTQRAVFDTILTDISTQSVLENLADLIGSVAAEQEVVYFLQSNQKLVDHANTLVYSAYQKPVPGATFRHASDLLAQGFTVHGIEDMALYFQTTTQYVGLSAADAVQKLLGVNQLMAGDLEQAIGPTKEVVAYKSWLAGLQQGLVGKGYLPEDKVNQQELQKVKQELCMDARTNAWVDYLADKESMLVVCGEAHIPVFAQIADSRKIKYEVV